MVNIIPTDETHRLDTTCECQPEVQWNLPEVLVVHRPFDNRDPNQTLDGRRWRVVYE